MVEAPIVGKRALSAQPATSCCGAPSALPPCEAVRFRACITTLSLALWWGACSPNSAESALTAIADGDTALATDVTASPDTPALAEVFPDAGLGPDGAEIGEQRRCNGMTELCGRPLNRVVFAATHNAMSSEADGWFGPNQQFGMEQQLADGVRAMLIDTHYDGSELALCHGLCVLGSIPLSEALASFKAFFDANPHEVLVLIIQDGTATPETAAAFDEADLTPLIYTHPAPADPMPTLGELIDRGQRLVVTAESGAPPPAWYHHVRDLTWDTPYSFNSLEDFDCRCNRGCPKDDKAWFLMNHWLSTVVGLPDASKAEVVNGFDFLHGRAMQCWNESGRVPNFIAVDHYAVGDLFEVVDALNRAVGEAP